MFIFYTILMKRNYYQIHERITDDCYLFMNTMDESFLFLDKYAYDIYSNTENVDEIETMSPKLYARLKQAGLIIPDDYDEKEAIRQRRKGEQNDESLYQVIVNPTLGCNLSCWYCYEHKKQGSKISPEVIEGIKRNIAFHYANRPYKDLKLSFFGGEPLMCFDEMMDLCKYADTFCREHGVGLLIDITTNGTLLDEERVRRLAGFSCLFQITLDGNHDQHNKIKFTKDRAMDTYAMAVRNIKLIQDIISDTLVYVRINFDKDTLDNFDSILRDIDSLDRKRTVVILKKIWQVDSGKIIKGQVVSAIEKLFDHGFVIDYYTQGGLCFAEMKNEVVVNYDGNVFKCTTIDRFDMENSLGRLNTDTGEIMWNEKKIERLFSDISVDRCAECRIYPTCYGPCNFHLLTGSYNCFLDDLSLSKKEYLMFLYKKERQRKSFNFR